MHKPFLILFILVASTVFSQEAELMNTWIMNEVYDCSGDSADSSEETFWNINFRSNGMSSIMVDKSLKIEKSYTLDGRTIILPHISYVIEKITKDSLLLVDSKIPCKKYFFLSQSAIEKEKSNKFFLYRGDTVYFATHDNYPKLKGYSSYHEYFIRSFPNLGKTLGCAIQFQFIVTKNGELLNPKGNISCLKDDTKKVAKIVEDMKGNWEPMMIDGKPVNALVREKFTHGKVTTISR